jgi:hypothetical protein
MQEATRLPELRSRLDKMGFRDEFDGKSANLVDKLLSNFIRLSEVMCLTTYKKIRRFSFKC